MFIAEPSADQIMRALQTWPEIAGQRIRPLLVTAFGEIFAENKSGEVFSCDPIELTMAVIAGSVSELESLFNNPTWAEERLLTNVVFHAEKLGITRERHQVFGFAPHPSFTGEIDAKHCQAMEVVAWHTIAGQLR